MKRFLTLLALTSGLAATASAGIDQITSVRLGASIDVVAPPHAVWSYLTTGKNFVTWCPQWAAPGNAKVNLTKVGDVLDFTDEWGNGGKSIVTYYVSGKELRVSHEPDNGSYVCQARVVLTPNGKMTNVMFIEQYTDESAASDLQATAAKVEAGMKENLSNVKKAVEKK